MSRFKRIVENAPFANATNTDPAIITLSAAYLAGTAAYGAGVKRNPHRYGSNEYDQWATGRNTAEFEDQTVKAHG
jgi:hypothetical protein